MKRSSELQEVEQVVVEKIPGRLTAQPRISGVLFYELVRFLQADAKHDASQLYSAQACGGGNDDGYEFRLDGKEFVLIPFLVSVFLGRLGRSVSIRW